MKLLFLCLLVFPLFMSAQTLEDKKKDSIIVAAPIEKELSTPKENNQEKTYSSECAASQCTGKTQKGTRCRNMTKNCNGRCHYH